MTSLTAVAHAAPAAPAFNRDFYVTAATVIPVLFLAIAVQGRGYQTLLDVIITLGQWVRRGPGALHERLSVLAVAIMLIAIAAAILLFGAGGEISAVYALYQQQAKGSTGAAVLVSMIVMIILTAVAPFLAGVVRTYIARGRSAGMQNFNAPASPVPGVGTGSLPAPETDKPDPV
jgi:hypothetical protein